MKSIRKLLTPLNIIEPVILLIAISINLLNVFSDIITINTKVKLAAYSAVLWSILVIIEGIRIIKRVKYKVFGYIISFFGFFVGLTIFLDLVLDIV